MSFENGSRVMNGTYATVTVDGQLWAEASAVQAKVTKTKEDVQCFGMMAVDSKVTAIKGTGSITLTKVYTRNKDMAGQIAGGKDVRSTIVAALDDPDANGAERFALYNCSFDDVTLIDAQAGKAGSVTLPFTFTRYEYLDAAEE